MITSSDKIGKIRGGTVTCYAEGVYQSRFLNANEQASCIITTRDDLQEDTVRRPERRVNELFELSRTGGSLNTINEDRF